MDYLSSKKAGFFVQASNDSQFELRGGNLSVEENKDLSNNGKGTSQIPKLDISENEQSDKFRAEHKRNSRKSKKSVEEPEEPKKEKEISKINHQNHEEEKNEAYGGPPVYNQQTYLSQLDYINNTLNQMGTEMSRLFQQLQYDFALRQSSFYTNPNLAEQWGLLLDSSMQIGQIIEELKNMQNFSTQPTLPTAFANGYPIYSANQAGMYIEQTQNQ